jgi:hypothetical protein
MGPSVHVRHDEPRQRTPAARTVGASRESASPRCVCRSTSINGPKHHWSFLSMLFRLQRNIPGQTFKYFRLAVKDTGSLPLDISFRAKHRISAVFPVALGLSPKSQYLDRSLRGAEPRKAPPAFYPASYSSQLLNFPNPVNCERFGRSASSVSDLGGLLQRYHKMHFGHTPRMTVSG